MDFYYVLMLFEICVVEVDVIDVNGHHVFTIFHANGT